MVKLMRIALRDDTDMVHSRQRARQIAELLQLDSILQTRVATAVSEVARNALKYAGGGEVTFDLQNEFPFTLFIRVEDNGPGIEDFEKLLASTQGQGLKGCLRLMDICRVENRPEGGTKILLGKVLNLKGPLEPHQTNRLIDELLRMRPQDAMAEVRLQNSELLQSLEELRVQEEVSLRYLNKLEELNKELADTNRGVIALNTELEDQARTVREASEVKARFLSHITHEFRTPVNSMLSMSRILLGAGPLSDDQTKQVSFIHQAAEYLSTMVNDLLDTVKADAGKWEVNLAPVRLSEVFDTLRALFKPLTPTDRDIQLVFQEEGVIPLFLSDEMKISQILRNFISNAFKFTEEGVIKVSASIQPDQVLEISVDDAGIGISPEHQSLIFEEFMQVQSQHQRRSKGTGLGLPLARKLARLIDGDVSVHSEFGRGSTFALHLPLVIVPRE